VLRANKCRSCDSIVQGTVSLACACRVCCSWASSPKATSQCHWLPHERCFPRVTPIWWQVLHEAAPPMCSMPVRAPT
jgi:hypothetical protein